MMCTYVTQHVYRCNKSMCTVVTGIVYSCDEACLRDVTEYVYFYFGKDLTASDNCKLFRRGQQLSTRRFPV